MEGRRSLGLPAATSITTISSSSRKQLQWAAPGSEEGHIGRTSEWSSRTVIARYVELKMLLQGYYSGMEQALK